MNWNKNPYRHTAYEAESLAYPPSGGKGKMALLGFILPVAIIYLGLANWFTQEAEWFGNRGSVKIHAEAAKSMGALKICIALFCHFRYFWGLIPIYRVYQIGTTASLIGILCGFGAIFYHTFKNLF